MKNLKPIMRSVPLRVSPVPATEQQRSKYRRANQPGVEFYHTAKWQRLRLSVFERDLFTCQLCRRIEGNTSKLVGDHIRPHKGSRELFFDSANVQTLCFDCHVAEKQRRERDGAGLDW